MVALPIGSQLLTVAASLIASVSLTPAARTLAVHLGAVDHPGPRKVHSKPIPLLGGLAMYVAVGLATSLFAERTPEVTREIIGIFSGATLLVIVGSLDDRGLLHPQIKLMGAMPAAAAILMAVGIHASVFVAVFGSSWFATAADLALTLVWVVGITAAFSILDHMDGLCAGVAGIAAAFFLVLALGDGQGLAATLAAAVFGAAVGFLVWNFNPARIFMGDGGAMFLGFLMATLGLNLRMGTVSISPAMLVPVFVLLVPIFDTTLVTISRSRRGLLPFSTPGKDHTSHRLVSLGLSHRIAVLSVYLVGCVGGTMALMLTRANARTGYAIAVVSAVAAAAIIASLERSPYERQERRRSV